MGQSQSLVLEDGNLENDQIIIQSIENSTINPKPIIESIENNTSNISTDTKNREGQNVNSALNEMDENINNEESNTSETCIAPIATQSNEEKKSEYKNIEEYAVNYAHVNIAITEFSDSMGTNDSHSGFKLQALFEQMNVETSDCTMWNVGTKQSAKNRMKSVLEFAENNPKCSKDIKLKLRIITRLIMESKNKNDFKYILLLIASHGNVCNVMKEVAINNAYHTMTNNMREYIKSQSLQQQILRVLYDFRVLLVEELFHSFQFCNNTHYIAFFHNQIAQNIGVKPYNDPDICFPTTKKCKDWKQNLDKRFLKTMYTTENIIQCIYTQINEQKIGYQKIVKFFEDNCPKHFETKSEFLGKAIDIDTGQINEGCLCWLLEELEVFTVKTEEWKEIEKCWEDIVEPPSGANVQKKKKRKRRPRKKNKQKA